MLDGTSRLKTLKAEVSIFRAGTRPRRVIPRVGTRRYRLALRAASRSQPDPYGQLKVTRLPTLRSHSAGQFVWLRLPATTEIDSPSLRGRRRLNRRINLILSQESFHRRQCVGIQWESMWEWSGNLGIGPGFLEGPWPPAAVAPSVGPIRVT